MKLDYNSYVAQGSNSPKSGERSGPYVGYFSLKEGEEAIVRILLDDISNIEIMAVHWAYMDGREGWINCPRAPWEPTDNCPYCKEGKPLSNRIYLKVLQYVTDEQGNIKTLAKIWDRPASLISILKDRIADYGPLSEIICKIKRHGTGTSTRYDIMPQAPNKYPDNIYPKKEDMFKDFNIIGHSVREINSRETTATESISKQQEEITSQPVPVTTEPKPIIDQAPNIMNNFNGGDGFERPRRFFQ